MGFDESPDKNAVPERPVKKSNTWIIVLVVVLALAVPVVCVGSVIGVAFLRYVGLRSEGMPPAKKLERPEEPSDLRPQFDDEEWR